MGSREGSCGGSGIREDKQMSNGLTFSTRVDRCIKWDVGDRAGWRMEYHVERRVWDRVWDRVYWRVWDRVAERVKDRAFEEINR